jgi:hypothetical protein
MSRGVDDSHGLGKYVLYKQIQLYGLFDIINESCEDRNPPYFFDVKGYLLIIWIMTVFKEDGHHNMLELFYNIKPKNVDPWLKMLSTF